MKKTVLLVFLFLFSFCSKRESQYPRIIVPEIDNAIEVNSKHMLQSQPSLLQMNFTKDTTVPSNLYRSIDESSVKFKRDTVLPRYDLKIIIDASYNFHYKDFEYKWLDLSKKIDSLRKLDLKGMDLEDAIGTAHFDKLYNQRKKQVVSYPLLIYNNEKSDSYIYNSYRGLSLIQEAKDTDGKWKPIEYLNSLSGCFISNEYYKLKPKNYFATSIIKYHGDFKTKIRVKILFNYHYYYSNEIEGFINRSQFDDNFLNIRFYSFGSPDMDQKWAKEMKEYSLLKHKY